MLLGGSVCTYKHSNTLTKPQKHSLYVNVISVYECIWVNLSVNTYIHLHSNTLKYTQIHSNTHITFTYSVFECMWVFWVYLSVFECIWVYLSVFEGIWVYVSDVNTLKYSHVHSHTRKNFHNTHIHSNTFQYTSNTQILWVYMSVCEWMWV